MKRAFGMVFVWILFTAGLVQGFAQTSQQTPRKSTRKQPPSEVIDINKASVKELAKLPGLGPELAHRIEEYRAKSGPFERVEELLNVPGIGPKKFKALSPFVKVEEKAKPEGGVQKIKN